MAPSAAVEIDPRLLRQLEEEYETLKNDSSGARGLVSPTPASARLLIPVSDDTSLTSRLNHDVRPGPHPAGPPTDFSKWIKRRLRQAKSAGLIRVAKPTAARTLASAPAVSRPAKAYSPAAYDAEASSSAATTEATPARAPARTPKPAPEPAPSPKPTAPAVQAPAERPDAPLDAESPAPRAFSPVVFQPRGTPSPDREDDREDHHHSEHQTEHQTDHRADPSAPTDDSAPWFDADDSAAAAGVAVPRPGSESDRMARTVVGVGERARRMAEATALAQRDMARRLAETGAPRVGRGDGTVSRGYDTLLALQAERGARAEKSRQVDALRRRENALAMKNKELEASLSAHAARTREQERAVREAKAAADAARAELQAALVRARLGGRAAPMFTARAAGVAGVRGVRASQPITAHERVAPAADAPKTLQEAAARFLAAEVGEGAAADHLAASLREAGMRPATTARSTRDSEERRRRREERGRTFLERMQARQEEAARRRAEREWMHRATVAATSGGRKGWDNSRDVVVRVGEEPPPPSSPLEARAGNAETRTPSARGNGKGKGGKRTRGSGADARKRSSQSAAARAAAERQRVNDERRSRGLEPIFDKQSPGAKPAKKPKSATRVGARTTEPDDAEMRATASRMLSTSEGRASLRASGFDLGHPGAQPTTGLFSMSPGRRVGAAGGDPRKEIAAMRTILDEVVAHLRALHMAANAGGDRDAAFPVAPASAEKTRLRDPGASGSRGNAHREDARSSPRDAARSGPSSVASSAARLSGPFVLDSIQHSKALEMLREVEAREAATRARWGLFSPAHPPPEDASGWVGRDRGSGSGSASWRHRDVVARASADIAAIEAETRGAAARASLEARSLRLAGVAALESLVDEDTVARVWEARSQFVRWQEAAGDGVVSEGGPEGDFSPVEVNEEVAERLLDGLLTDVAVELGGACDEATEIVLRREFEPRRSTEESGEGYPGSYDVGSSLLDDDVVGPAVERAYLSRSAEEEARA
jgi:hypothetical protein